MKAYTDSYAKFQNLYWIWFTENGKLSYEEATEENEERVIEKFKTYFPTATIEEIELRREHVKCY